MASIFDLAGEASDSENDFDYVPSEEEGSELSLDDNTDEDETASVVAEPASAKKKRNRRKKGKRNLKVKNEDAASEEVEDKTKNCGNEEDEKKRAESLWEDFIKDVTPPVPKKLSGNVSKGIQLSASSESEKKDELPNKITVSEIFEFAGEAVVVTKEVDRNSDEAKASDKTLLTSSTTQSPSKDTQDSLNKAVKRPGGLDSVLGAISNKKQKLSTLQKSMLDWKSFKKEEGIEEELDQHRRSRDSYVEKQAFLQRTDLRQFEIEKNIRQSSRSNQ